VLRLIRFAILFVLTFDDPVACHRCRERGNRSLEKVVLLAAIVGMSDLAVPASRIGTNFELLDSGRPVSRLPGKARAAVVAELTLARWCISRM
jgi:hypothetical protein